MGTNGADTVTDRPLFDDENPGDPLGETMDDLYADGLPYDVVIPPEPPLLLLDPDDPRDDEQ